MVQRQAVGDVVAVKMLHEWKWNPERGLKLCLREAWTWSQLNHPNIVPLLGVANHADLRGTDSALCMISPWSSHGNAEIYVQHLSPNTVSVLDLCLDIATALEYLHRFVPPIIHGDLKANNVLIYCHPEFSNGRPRACLTDFGLSRSWLEGESHEGPSSTTPAGNTRWMAFERILPQKYGFVHGPRTLTRYSDTFEMARTFLQMMTKQLPYAPLNDWEALQHIFAGENPDRPETGILQSHDGLWDLLLQCWNQTHIARPPLDYVKAMIESYQAAELSN